MQISLWPQEKIPYYLPGEDTPNKMTAYLSETEQPAPAVIVFPGGGYSHRAAHEGEPIAQFYQSRGFHAFVVDYRLLPHRFPTSLADAQRAIRIVRSRAAEWNVDPDRIFVLGFSAGGHLAACTATLDDVAQIGDELDSISVRPNGAILCYAFISALSEDGGATARCGSHILEETENTPEDISLQLHVTPQTPPCFLWHTAEDGVVPVTQTLDFASALIRNGVLFESHIYPHGKHGLGLAPDYPDVSGWAELSADWILRNFPRKEE